MSNNLNKKPQPSSKGHAASNKKNAAKQKEAPSISPSHVKSDFDAYYVKDEFTLDRELCVVYPSKRGVIEEVLIKAEHGDNAGQVTKRLKQRGAVFPCMPDDHEGFVKSLLEEAQDREKLLVYTPGYRGLTCFVLPEGNIGPDKHLYKWGGSPANPAMGDVGRKSGSLQEWIDNVSTLMTHSSILSLSAMMALAAPLMTYVRLHEKGNLLMETGTVNFPGPSGSGKTTTQRVAAGMIGHPDLMIDYDFTRRGFEEAMASRNDMIAIIDDTEKFLGEGKAALRTALRHVTQIVPKGRSKTMSNVNRAKGLHPLHWSNFASSSGPKWVSELYVEGGRKMTEGEAVRFFDVPVPPRKAGGVLDQLEGDEISRSRQAKKIIKALERELLKNYGHIFRAWINFLGKADYSDEIIQKTDAFVQLVAPYGDGFEQRFARKFGVFAAAGQIATEAGLLDWPDDWALKAAQICYFRAHTVAFEYKRLADRLAKAIVAEAKRPGALKDPAAKPNVIFNFGQKTVGLLTDHKGTEVIALRDETLLAMAGGNAAVLNAFKDLMKVEGLHLGGHGNRSTTQLNVQIKVEGEPVAKPRFYLIDFAGLKKLAGS